MRERLYARQRLLAFGLLAAALLALALLLALSLGGHKRSPAAARSPARATAVRHSYAVGLQVLRLVDRSRTISLPDGSSEPRTLVTYVRYPALAAPGGDRSDAQAARGARPFPLIVFGHGYALRPAAYAPLLRAWTRAGYVVAAPAFPLENAEAPGGPDESDLTNQPADMRFVISQLLAASSAAGGPLAGLIDPSRVAVGGHSDGGDTALALAYDRDWRDPRVKAAVILSGAQLPGLAGFDYRPGEPPLLATQGTADTVNRPSETEAFFAAAQRPKYLLRLTGAEHLPPYSHQQPQLAIVERVTLAFLDGYLKGNAAALGRLSALGNVAGRSTLSAAR